MVPQSNPLRPACVSQYLRSDLLEMRDESAKISTIGLRVFKVLSHVLSDLEIHPGGVLPMRAIEPGESPEAYAIVAARFVWTGALLLRQFVPPRILITNSRENAPHLYLGRSLKIIACLETKT